MTINSEDPNEKRRQYVKGRHEKLLGQVSSGQAPWQKSHDSLPITIDKHISFNTPNSISLMISATEKGYTDPRWATKAKLQSMGIDLKAGEEKNPTVIYKLGDNPKDPLKPAYLPVAVYNAEQCVNVPPYIKPDRAEKRFDEAEKIIAKSGAKYQYTTEKSASYKPSIDTIQMPQKEMFLDNDRFYSVKIHELGHRTLAKMYNIEKPTPANSLDRAREELRVEIFSMVASHKLDIPHNPERHAGYKDKWAQLLSKDTKELQLASADVDQMVNRLQIPDLKHSTSLEINSKLEVTAPVMGASSSSKTPELESAGARNGSLNDTTQRHLEKRRQTQEAHAQKYADEVAKLPRAEKSNYLEKHNVKAFGIHQKENGNIVIPAYDADGKVWSFQEIDNKGSQAIAPNSKFDGTMFVVGGSHKDLTDKKPILLTDQYVSAAAVHEATGRPVVMAFDSENVKSVAVALRSKNESAQILILGSRASDRLQADFERAGKEVGAKVIYPYPSSQKGQVVDFNGVHGAHGPGVLHIQVEAEIKGLEPTGKVQDDAKREHSREQNGASAKPKATSKTKNVDPESTEKEKKASRSRKNGASQSKTQDAVVETTDTGKKTSQSKKNEASRSKSENREPELPKNTARKKAQTLTHA